MAKLKNKMTKTKNIIKIPTNFAFDNNIEYPMDFCNNCGDCDYCNRYNRYKSSMAYIPSIQKCEICDSNEFVYPLENVIINSIGHILCEYCNKDYARSYSDFYTVMTFDEIVEYIELFFDVESYQPSYVVYFDHNDRAIEMNDENDDDYYHLEYLNKLYSKRYEDHILMTSKRMTWITACVSLGQN
jgi:hypothetical protein